MANNYNLEGVHMLEVEGLISASIGGISECCKYCK